jgi:lipoprotein-anchoring transpeptidase ErfK/SrfK
MVDYFAVLVRAVAQLDPNTSERRQAIYARVRHTLIEKIRSGDPQFSGSDPAAEREALEAAINRVEAEAMRRVARPPRKSYRTRPPLKDTRKRFGVVVGAIAATIILVAGVAAYLFWPRSPPTASNVVQPRRVAVEGAAAERSYVYMRQIVYYRTNYPVGTIVVDRSRDFLYVVRPNLAALRYTIGVGSECAELVGLYQVVQKEEWPGWNAQLRQASDTADDRARNPLGARALDLNKGYRIHGTSESVANAIRAAKRCIGLANNDVIDLYERTPLGSRVIVLAE